MSAPVNPCAALLDARDLIRDLTERESCACCGARCGAKVYADHEVDCPGEAWLRLYGAGLNLKPGGPSS